MNEDRVSRGQALLEASLFALGGLAFVLSVAFDVPRRWAIVTLALALLAFAFSTRMRRLETLRDFGIRFDNFWASAREVGLFTLAAAALIVAVALTRGVSFDRPELWVLLPLYPLYGIAQQLAVQGVLHRRLRRLAPNPFVCVVLTALGFGLLHANDLPLLALTTFTGLFWSWLYSREANVVTLGISHGMLAALAYPLLVETNPLNNL